MKWLVLFLAYIEMVTDESTKILLYRMALYHLHELYHFYDEDHPCDPTIVAMRATFTVWRQLIHSAYEGLRYLQAQRNGEPLEACSCAICVPPGMRLFTPGYFWNLWNMVRLSHCTCLVCQQQAIEFPHHPTESSDAATQTMPPASTSTIGVQTTSQPSHEIPIHSHVGHSFHPTPPAPPFHYMRMTTLPHFSSHFIPIMPRPVPPVTPPMQFPQPSPVQVTYPALAAPPGQPQPASEMPINYSIEQRDGLRLTFRSGKRAAKAPAPKKK